MGDDRGGFALTTLGCRFVARLPARRRANVVRPEQAEAPGSAPCNRGSDPRLIGAGSLRPGQAPRVANLVDVYYSEGTAIEFKETGIPGCKQREVESASATRDS